MRVPVHRAEGFHAAHRDAEAGVNALMIAVLGTVVGLWRVLADALGRIVRLVRGRA